MGCFSYICKNCGESIKEDEGVKLFLLQEGKLLEEMEGNYTLYGDVDGHDWKNDWDDVVDLIFNNHRDDGIAAIHSDCWDGIVPTENSEDDIDQGCGSMTTRKTDKKSHTFYSNIQKSRRMVEDENKLKDLGDRLSKTLADTRAFLDKIKNGKG